MFESFMQEEHFSALNMHILYPPFFNVADKVRMGEPNVFKPERYVS